MAIPYKPKPTENTNTSSTAADVSHGNSPANPANSSQQTGGATEMADAEKTARDAETTEKTPDTKPTEKTTADAEPTEKTVTDAETTEKTAVGAALARKTETDAQPIEKTELGAEPSGKPAAGRQVLLALTGAMPSDKAVTVAVGDAATKETNPENETPATTKPRARVKSQVSTDSSDLALNNLAVTTQLEQLAQRMVEEAFQFTDCAAKGTAKNTGVNDTEEKETKVNDTEVKDDEVKDTEVKDDKAKDTALDTVVGDTDVKDTEVNDTGVKDTEENDTEVKDIDGKDEMRDNEVGNTEVRNTRVKDGKAETEAEPTGMVEEIPKLTDKTATEADSTEKAEAGVQPTKAEGQEELAAPTSAVSSDEAAAPTMGDPAATATISEDETSATTETQARVKSQVSLDSSDLALKNLAVTAQLEQLAQRLAEAAFQFTGCATKGTTTEVTSTTQVNNMGAEVRGATPEVKDPATEPKDTEVADTEIDFEVEYAKVKDIEVMGVELRDAEVKGTEMKDAGVKTTEMKNTKVKDVEVKDTEVKNTNVKVAEVKDADVKNTKVKDTEVKGTEVKNTELRDDEMKDAELKDTEVKGTEMKNAEVKDSKVKGTEVKGTEVKDTEKKDTKVKGAEVNATTDVKEETADTKNMTTKFTETVARSTAACFKPMDCAPQLKTPVTSESPFSIDKLPKCILPTPGLKFLPELAWPVSDRPWPWAATPRVRSEEPPLPDRAEPGVMYGVLIDSHVIPETADDQLNSKPKGGARRKVRPPKKSKGKSTHTIPPSVQQNGTTANGSRSMNGDVRSSPDTTHRTAEPRSSTRHPTETPHTKIDVGRLCCGYPSPRKLSAAVSTFQKQCAAACKAQVPRERPFVNPVPGECCGSEERKVPRSGVWWRREMQQKVRRRGRIGLWFDRRFERGVVHCDPPPPVKYTGFSTARASDFLSLDPKVFPRGSPIQLGHLWLPKGVNTSGRTHQSITVASKLMQLNSVLSGVASVIEGNPGEIPSAASEETAEKNAAPESGVTQSNDTRLLRCNAPEDEQQNGERTGAVPKNRSLKGEPNGELAKLGDEEQQQVVMMEEITERYLHMGGSLADIMNMVNNPQQVIKTALEEAALTRGEVAEANEGANGSSEVAQMTSEETRRTNGKTETEDSVDDKKDAVGDSASVLGEAHEGKESAVDGTQDAISETEDPTEETECSDERAEDTTEMTEGAVGQTEGVVGGLGVIPSDKAELEVVEAIAMELDDRRVFTSNEQDHYESRLSDIDAKMRRVREKSDFIQQEYARITEDVDSIRQTLPEMDDVFASLKSFSAAVLSGVKAKDKTTRKPFPGGELPEVPFQQTTSSGKKPPRISKSDGRKRAGEPGDSASPNRTNNTSDRHSKEKINSTDKTSVTLNSDGTTKLSSDTGSGAKCQDKSSTSAESGTSCPTRPQVELAAADSTTEPPTSEHPTEPEYPRVMGSKELRPVAGLPPPGDYIPQHIHLLQPAESDIARSETGEERTNILSPIGRLAWAMPHRFMSSKQLLEVHSLLRSEGGANDPLPIDTLRWVQDSGGQHLQVIHRFFQCGCDRRYHHVKLKGKPVALSKISSCGMLEYLQVNQWRWPALVSPNTFVSGRGSGDGMAPNPYRTNDEIEMHMKEGDLFRVSGITAYIRDMVRHICERLVSQLERRLVTCIEERDAVASLLTVLIHRWNEATREPAGIVLMYALHNDSLLEGELRHTNRFVKLRCENHSVPIGCPSWSCQLWLWLLHETCRLVLEGEHKFVQSLGQQQRQRARPPTDGTPPPPYHSTTYRGGKKRRPKKK